MESPDSRSEFFTPLTRLTSLRFPKARTGHLRISDARVPVDRNGHRPCLDVRRLDGDGRSSPVAERVTKRSKVIASSAIHPEYLQVAHTYVQHAGIELQHSPYSNETGATSADSLSGLDERTAAVVVQSPNFVGCVEDVQTLADKAHAVGALLIVVVTEAMSFGLLKSPGACGADIVVAEGQSFGVPLSYGGPYVGLFATREKYARQIPGRLVGEAFDANGRRGYVLTLATREQHIRREKATSNICTNEGLIALAATIYLETMGPRGIEEVAKQCAQKAHYAARRISEIDGFSLGFSAPFFNEFVVSGPGEAAPLLARLASERESTRNRAVALHANGQRFPFA